MEFFSPVRSVFAAALVAAAWAASPARAQAPAGTETAAVAAPQAGPAGRFEDANIDRGWFSPTAMTQPAGTFVFNDYELFFMGLTYAPVDRFQLTATFLTPIASEMCCYGIIGGKLRLVDAGLFHFSALGSLALASVPVDVDLYGEGPNLDRASFWAVLAGGAATVCFSESCNSLVSAWVTTGFNGYSDKSVWPILYGASIAVGGSHVKVLLEADSAALLGDVTQAARGALVTYGIRFTSKNIAGDVGFTRPFGEGVDTGGLVMGFPILTFTYRAL